MADVASTIQSNGELIRLRHYEKSWSGTSDYDEEYITLQATGGTIWVKGMHFPISDKAAGEDHKYLEQGIIRLDDKKLYLAGSVTVYSTGSKITKIGIGSPTTDEYQIIERGIQTQSLGGTDVYHKIYIRYLTAGSFIGEY